jgi:chromosome segregation protein
VVCHNHSRVIRQEITVYLKSLKLVGFKSFADRTRLEFRPGVTVIVGPNGSGKSNLVDALSWVMGTQSARSLRTGKMEDVVFAGTATRPSLNRAEATLIIDNRERMLPLDLDEVSLTRRLYRDGSSDYEINGVDCRLLDVQELLSDSGVGRHQHVIVGQGHVESVLNASSEEHRAVVEEAAGILKHRRRKEKAERRLERTDEDMHRLQDLLGEIERQLRPLRRQARAADRYDGLKAEVRELRLYLAGITLAGHDAELGSAKDTLDRLTEQVSSDEVAVKSLSAALENLTSRASDLGADLDRDTGAAARLETTIERLRRLGSIAHERTRALSGRKMAGVERKADLEAERTQIQSEMAEVDAAESDCALAAESRESRFRVLEDEERAIATQTALSPEGALAAVRGELSVLHAAGVRDAREVEAIERRIEVVTAQLRDEAAEIAGINDEVHALDELVSELQSAYQRVSRRRETDQEAWSRSEEELNASRLEVAAADARLDAVRSALTDGPAGESRRSFQSASGSLGAVHAVLDVPSGLERAVGAALGRWRDAIAFTDAASMRGAVEMVKSDGGGGVPVVAAGGFMSSSASEVAAREGVEALADLLGPRADTDLAASLLGDVVLVEGWAAAWALVSRHPAIKAVTPEGDLVSVEGIHVAQSDEDGSTMLDGSVAAADRARTDLARATSIHTAAKRDFDKSRERERIALEELENVEISLAGKSEAMGRLQKSVDALEGERDRLRQRLGSLHEASLTRDGRSSELTRRLQALEGEERELARVWEDLEARRALIATERESARSEWQEAAGFLHRITERRRLLEERLDRIESEVGRIDSSDGGAAGTEVLDAVERYSRKAVETLQRRLTELRERQAGLRAAHEATVGELGQARTDFEVRRSAISSARDQIADIQVRLTELRMMRESLIEGVRRDADADAQAALAAPRPDYPEDADLSGILEEKGALLRRLGPINPLAAAEHAELDQRHRFLSDQMADVEASRSELRKVIRALEEEIDHRFQEAFDEVAEAYQRYFSLLFPGGKGRIRLEDADDPRSGLVIDAQPLGKKVSQLSLLSGGERSLAALAFLFSIFEARPSPFYVLDEVEAALDDANLRRFLRIVDEFRIRAQLLIITHQQQTMEAADVLYGVTMEPGGSSQVVRKDMTTIGIELSA